MHELSPAELVLARSRAFCRGDFGFIFDSYHAESNFRRQFLERDEYLQFGRASLGRDYRILRTEILAERVLTHEAQVIFLLDMQVHGEVQQFAELAWLRREGSDWRYHRSQKMTAEELPADPRQLDFTDFARLDPATVF